MNAFILAAGRGERLGPITALVPKPLLPILGQPMIEMILAKLSLLNVERYGINLYYKRDLLTSFLSTVPTFGKIILFPEEAILGTGGALSNAASLLRQGIFITHNADILSDIDIKRLLDYHLATDNLATLAVHDYPLYNNVWIDKNHRLLSIGTVPSRPHPEGSRCIAFTGIAAYSPEFLDYVPQGYSHLTDAWLSAASATRRVGCLDYTGCSWSDIGTPAAYAEAVFSSLRHNGETIFIHPNAVCGDAHPGGGTVLEDGVRITGSPSMKNCIIMPDTHISGSPPLDNQIVGPGYSIPLEVKSIFIDGFPGSLLNGILKDNTKGFPSLIGTGGSDRRYYRLRTDGSTVVIMESPAGDDDFDRNIIFSRFFKQYGLPVPALIASEDKNTTSSTASNISPHFAVFEDLGDLSLYSWLKCGRDSKRTARLYEQIIMNIVIPLHTIITDHAAECPLLVSRSFDYEHLRWETSYFMDQFVRGFSNTGKSGFTGLNNEFHRLANKVSAFTHTIVHRDLQSQNIMMTPEDDPRIIDYQGARLGPPAYDIASLLWDPYAPLAPGLRDHLLAYYLNAMKQYSPIFDDTAFLDSLLPCRLQRHMQALGAYSFLARAKGKSSFLKFITPCLEHLKQEAKSTADEFPLIYSLLRTLNDKR